MKRRDFIKFLGLVAFSPHLVEVSKSGSVVKEGMVPIAANVPLEEAEWISPHEAADANLRGTWVHHQWISEPHEIHKHEWINDRLRS